LHHPDALRDLHSFPTRRSSDLAEHSADEIEGEDGRVLPVSGHHAADGDSFAALEGFGYGGFVGLCYEGAVAEATLDGSADPIKRSEEHTSELQSLRHLVCRLLL